MSLLSPNLQAFVAVAKRQTVQHAAKDLALTQTGVTQRLRTLERALGISLFTRSRKGMRLTTEGEALLRYCQNAHELEGEFFARLNGTGVADGRVTRFAVSGPSSLMRSRVIPQLTSVLARFPNVRLTFDISDDAGGLAKLKRGVVELAVLAREHVVRELDSKLLKPERYVLVVPPAWRSRDAADVVREETIIDFDAADEQTHAYLRQHDLLGRLRPERHFANNTDALAALIAAAAGYSVLTEEFAEPLVRAGVVAVLQPAKAFEVAQALAWYPRPEMGADMQALVDAVT